MKCLVKIRDGEVQCERCGQPFAKITMADLDAIAHDPERIIRTCTAKGPRALLGLGDALAAALHRVGFTQERVSRWLGKPCGCGQRQDAWNRLGWALMDRLRNVRGKCLHWILVFRACCRRLMRKGDDNQLTH